MTWSLDVAMATAAYGALACLAVPALIAKVPEPPEPGREEGAAGSDAAGAAPGDGPEREPKEAYAAIAALPHLRSWSMLVGAVVGFLVGGSVGHHAALLPLLYLIPVGTALAVIDWRTRLLPTRLIAPSYAAVGGLVLVAAWLDRDPHALLVAFLGWLIAGGTFFVLWFVFPAGMGYGDVRLSGVLGLALGYQGWAVLLVGVYAGFLIGGVGGLLLSLLRIVDRKAYPFGPFMLVGAVAGVVLAPLLFGG